MDPPISLMMAVELGSIDADEMSWFHRSVDGNGRNPFSDAPWPVSIALHAVVVEPVPDPEPDPVPLPLPLPDDPEPAVVLVVVEPEPPPPQAERKRTNSRANIVHRMPISLNASGLDSKERWGDVPAHWYKYLRLAYLALLLQFLTQQPLREICIAVRVIPGVMPNAGIFGVADISAKVS